MSSVGLLFLGDEPRQVGERRIEKIARRRRDERQRKAPRQLRIAGRRFARRNERRQRIVPLRGERAANGIRTCPTASGSCRARTVRRLPARRAAESRAPCSVSQSRSAARGSLGAKRLPREVVVAVREAGVGEAHACREQAKDLGVALRFAERRDRRIVRLRVQVAVRAVDVGLLELRGRRQQDVGVVGGVGLEDLVHDAEQVLARKAGRHFRGFGRDRDRIRVVDVDRANRRIVARRAARRRSRSC